MIEITSLNNNSFSKKVFNLLLNHPDDLLSSADIVALYKEYYDEDIKLDVVTTILSRLFRKHKVLRTPSQTDLGYIYTIRNNSQLMDLYRDYLLPYDIINKDRLINLMLNDAYNPLPNNDELFKGFQINKSNVIFLSKVVGFIMGDGHINKTKNSMQFYFKEKEDAEKFKSDFLFHYRDFHVRLYFYRYCYVCVICNKKLCLLLEHLGAPIGNKVFQPFLFQNG